MTIVQSRLPVGAQLLACALMLSACASGIKMADQACSSSRTSAADFANCLRSNYGMLTNGADDDLGGLYLAEAEREASEVAVGNETDAQAMFNLAAFRMQKIAPVEQQRRDKATKQFIDALQSWQKKQSDFGSQQNSQSYARNSQTPTARPPAPQAPWFNSASSPARPAQGGAIGPAGS